MRKYKKDFILFIILNVIYIALSSFISKIIYIENDKISDIIVFLSILLGFKITSFSIMFNSNLLNILYDEKDKIYDTSLHKLEYYFSYSVYFDIVLIIFILLWANFNILFNIIKYKFIFSKQGLIVIGLFLSLYNFHRIAKILLEAFVFPRNNK